MSLISQDTKDDQKYEFVDANGSGKMETKQIDSKESLPYLPVKWLTIADKSGMRKKIDGLSMSYRRLLKRRYKLQWII